MFCLRNDWFKRFYIAIFHNDNDCLRYHRFHISFRFVRLSLLRVTMIVSVQWKNRLRFFVTKKYEMCRTCSLIEISLIDMHFLWSFLFYMIRFIYDSVFSMIVQFYCFSWTIISCLQLRIQMRMFFFNQRIVSDFLAHSLTSFW